MFIVIDISICTIQLHTLLYVTNNIRCMQTQTQNYVQLHLKTFLEKEILDIHVDPYIV